MILGHYGGVDEIAIFVVPAVLALLALRWVERRTKKNQSDDETE